MIRSIFVMFLLQWTTTRLSYGLEELNNSNIVIEQLNNNTVALNRNEVSMEDTTTLNFDINDLQNETIVMTKETVEPISQSITMQTTLKSTTAINVLNANLITTTQQPIVTFGDVFTEFTTTTKIDYEDIWPRYQPFRKDSEQFDGVQSMLVANEESSYNHNLEAAHFEEPLEDTTIIHEGIPEVDFIEDLTTIHPTTSKKEPKQIKIYKMSPNDILRNLVDDLHLRSPVAALVDKKSNPLGKAQRLWKAALRPNTPLDIVLVTYDSTGIKSSYNLTNTKTMNGVLNKIREESNDVESKTFYSIIRTAQLIPYDSAIFLSTDLLPKDLEYQQQASMMLLKKRIRMYLIMFDEKTTIENDTAPTTYRDTGYLGELALRTGGEIVYVPNNAFELDGELGLITLVVGNGLQPLDIEALNDMEDNVLRTGGGEEPEIIETTIESFR
ncbi:unnamed protein product [Diamesa serratosioi]